MMMLMVTVSIAGCGTKPTQETTSPAAPQAGVIDINTAVKAHPKYKELMDLEQQASTMAAEFHAQQVAAAEQAQRLQNSPPPGEAPQVQMDELKKNLAQEYNAKMADKQREASEKFASKEAEVNKPLNEEFNAYKDQLEKEYQPQIFNLQLKLKVVELSKDQAAVLQSELENLEAKRSEAMNLKHQQLEKRMNEQMATENASLQQEVTAYKKNLDDEFGAQLTAKQTEILSRVNEQQRPTATTEQVTNKIPEPLAAKQQEIEALQGSILGDITEKTGKVATADGLEIVLTHVVVNVNAVDITKQVITECNK